MFLRFIAASALICSISALAVAQTPQSNVILDGDIRIFTVAAALNVATSGDGGKFGTDLDPDLVLRLKQYYSVRKGTRSDESQFAQYFGLAVALTDPPELKPKVKEEQLPDETRALLSFLGMLREFYMKAHISQRWVEVHPQYEAEMSRLQPKISNVLLQTDAYLRTSLNGAGPRVMHIDAELNALPNSVTMRVYQNDYYVVLGPSIASGPASNMDAIRHAYLHFHLDEIVNRNLAVIANKDKLLALVSGEAGVDTAYTNQFGLMTVESLIRAMELRMDRATAARAKDVVANSYRSGLLLTPYFYDILPTFQGGIASFRDVYTQLVSGINYDAEHERFVSTFHSIPVPEKVQSGAENPEAQPDPSLQAVPADPVRELIVEAQTAYNSMDNDGSRALFERVLREYDPNNGAALYGLALLASRASDIEQSQLYFERTVKSNSADPGMKVWSYIYLGHIADLQCQRERAMEYYNQAVQVGDNSRDAQTSAKGGLSKAFGDQCR
jgi:tetratricopeptide (TPR) repeat protein